MGVSTIDGTIEEVVAGRRAAKVQFFKRIVFRLQDGSSKTIAKAVVHSRLAEHIRPGASGRFYAFTSIDHRGLHGLRDGSGHELFHFPRNNEYLMIGVVAFSALWAAIMLLAIGDVPIIAALILLFGTPAYFLFRKTGMEAKRQFEADGGFVAKATPAPASEAAAGA